MEKGELIELSKKLGMNQKAVEHHFQINSEAAEKQILEVANFMGLLGLVK